MTQSTFEDLGVAEPIRRALLELGYQAPSPIQQRAIPLLLEGRDLLGIAQTGTGKTAAFALPILQHLSECRDRAVKGPYALILAPTRELAIQIGAAIKTYSRFLKLRTAVVYGGVGQNPQVKLLRAGIDILIATPGRLLDLFRQGHFRLSSVTHLVLDEADRMLDMGFVRDVRTIVAALPKLRQSMLFSATLPAEITHLAVEMLRDPQRIEIAPAGTAVDRIEQRVFHVGTSEKKGLLDKLLEDPAMSRVLVFTRTKHRANRVADQLLKGGVAAAAIHGNKSQSARQAALDEFRTGRSRVLVATDIAARGIDVDAVTHIVNYELPAVPETYVHRIGRTARAGATGAALSFCDTTERPYLRDIEKLIRMTITVAGEHPTAIQADKGSSPPDRQRREPADSTPKRRRSSGSRHRRSLQATA